MIAASFQVSLKLRGPVLTHSTEQGRFGVDAVMARSGGHFYLPGTLVKGLIGEAWQELGCVDPSYATLRETWFGDENRRGRIHFVDLVAAATEADKRTATQYRIRIDEARGAVQQGAYLVMEAPYRSGEPVVFEGKLWMLAETRQEADIARKDIQTALNWVSSAGSERSVGFGRVIEGKCGPLEALEWSGNASKSEEQAFDLELRFTGPVCFAKRRVTANLFESEDWIAGGVLKGSLATLLAVDKGRWPNLSEHLHAIRFTHAFPSEEGKGRPVVLPQSLVMVKHETRDKIYDMVLTDQAQPIHDQAPSFQIDWKDDSTVKKAFGWKELEHELRVRTAIEGERKRATKEQLFAYRMIVPEKNVWRGFVFLNGVKEPVRRKVAEELDQVLQGGFLFALGKTKARASVRQAPAGLRTARLEGGQVAIMLQTAALLCDPSRHLAPHKKTGSSKLEAMREEYREVWRELSDGCLTLAHYYHRISLAGSKYMRHRFQEGKPYRPYLLTDPGSVFLLDIEDAAKAESYMTKWLNRGIELSPAVLKFYDLENVEKEALWKECPYLPENGYGEIAVDVHKTPRENVRVQGV